MNEHDSERIAGLLVADGLEATGTLEEADVVFFNTCCIRENADNRLYGNLGYVKSLKEAKPDMQIAVGGCLAQMDPEGLRKRAGHVDVIFGTHNISRAADLLHEAEASGPVMEILDGPQDAKHDDRLALGAVRDSSYAAWVTLQTGCDNSCAYCIVPAVRGGEISRPFEELVGEVEYLAARGICEVTLLGQNVNSYGRDITGRSPLFAELLRAVGAVDGIQRVRFTSPHPKDFRLETAAAMGETPEVCNQLHLPIQSGSDEVLKSMRRGYSAKRYLEKLAMARDAVPDLAVTTDLIVGFPGETDAQFEETLAVVAEAQFDGAYTFIFSPRPGTRAADMVDDFVDPEIISARYERLHSVVERSALLRHEARIGLQEAVLVDGPSRRNPAVMTGKTTQGKLVHFEATSAVPHEGDTVLCEITKAAPHFLHSTMISTLSAPSKRRFTVAAR